MRTTGEGNGGPRSSRRVAGLALGCVAAVGATAVVFLSDDPQVLRVAVVAVAWACLLAAFATARPARPARDDDRTPGAAGPAGTGSAVGAQREAELRAAHRRDLDTLRETERRRTEQVRRDAEAAVRRELEALRAEVAGLREGLSGLDALRREVAATGALHAELHAGLAGLGALRADVGRLRAELGDRLAGPLSGEMRVERVVMHAQSVRTGPGREPLEPATAAWSADVARELTGDWPAVPAPPAPVAVPAAPEPAPVARPLPAVPVPPAADRGHPARRRTDAPAAPHAPATYERPTVQRPAVHTVAAGHAGTTAVPAGPAAGSPDDPGAARLAEILAESGVRPGGRRRRYRDDGSDDGTPDQDVLARVLGRQAGPRESAPPSSTRVCPVTQPAPSR
ncbi:hypothetical protein SAMN04488107_3567 [Geodermatophilus saharensis]|uniref:Uncharacterized protein n=1 Tax=Geodermatophilus saharensis TaxID=1137994 RepID=A0A239GU47_9ACTN|nr:hypothetical protein [Geodermatophilus saharensis]SNS72405.1 hypothetical protein SAMN04488107_3567 [Geodermatophilus saharensis]